MHAHPNKRKRSPLRMWWTKTYTRRRYRHDRPRFGIAPSNGATAQHEEHSSAATQIQCAAMIAMKKPLNPAATQRKPRSLRSARDPGSGSCS